MNPAMLEASEDLTNLSHLNEPAGLNPLTDGCNVWRLIRSQSSKPSNYDMRRKRYIHTPV